MIEETYHASLFDSVLEPGDYVESHGKRLTFDEIEQRKGEMIILDCSTQSHAWYKAVLVEEIIQADGRRRLIYYDGKKQRGYIDERWFGEHVTHPAIAYEIKEGE